MGGEGESFWDSLLLLVVVGEGMDVQAVIELVKSRGGDPRGFRDAVHEAVHGLQLGVEDWSRRHLVLAFDALERDTGEDVRRLFEWECEARAAEKLACERAGIEYDVRSWATLAALESAGQGFSFQLEDFLAGIEGAREEAEGYLERIEWLLAG